MNKRKLLALVLALALCAGLLPVATLAAEDDFVIDEIGHLEKYNGPGGDVVIPEGVTSISNMAFQYCGTLTSVTIPEGVTGIGAAAFEGCYNLTSVTVPSSMSGIGSRAFADCYALTSIAIPNAYWIGQYAFARCDSLTSITIPGSVHAIENHAFDECGLTRVIIQDGVERIGIGAFASCRRLTHVTIPSSVTTIRAGAFSDCIDLTSVTIPASTTDIEENVFGYCPNLTVYGHTGSVAERYCQENGIAFKSMSNGYPAGAGRDGCLVRDTGQTVSWAITEKGKVTVDVAVGQLAPEEAVLVACYDSNGRFTGVKWIDAQHASAQIDPNTPNVKLFWLGAKQNPLAPNVTVWGR